jgi:hypothetical protein
MSIKKYFENTSLKKTTLNNLESKENIDFESFGYLDELEEQRNRFIPNVDFSKPENFARYGLAEQYYQDAADRITNNYPYDGSRQEVTEWYNDSTYFDLYVFENEYPRSNGYAVMSADGWGTQTSTTGGYGLPATLEYIYIKGGPHPGPNNTRVGGNIYSPADKRNSNLALNVSSSGATVEFWLKKDAFITGSTAREVVFDLWNNELSSSTSYGRFRIELNTSSAGNFASSKAFRLLLQSGSNNQEVLLGDYTTTASFNSQGWKQYAFAVTSGSSKLYINGELDSTASFSTAVGDVSGTLNAYLGALITTPSGSTATTGSGKLSGSLDEFRFWKIAREEREIERNWFTNVYGGTNTVDANTDLGVYFKFNEGITGVSATDSVVLDYSGRISNGAWTGYTSNSRNVGSAIVSSSAAASEFKDPILRTTNPLYTTFINDSLGKGKRHDLDNSSNLYYSFPDYIIDEDVQYGGDFKKLAQIISSYFDTAYLQVKSLRELKDIDYVGQTDKLNDKPKPFSDRLLTERGMVVPNLFIESNLLEELSQKTNNLNLESDLFDLKNLIYQNIYNNLTEIVKKKGTKEALRNTLHTFGVDQNLVKIRTYNDNETLVVEEEENFGANTVNFIDFSRINNRDAVIYQTGSAAANDLAYISGSTSKDRFTMEGTVVFPKIDPRTRQSEGIPSFLTSSVFGLHDILTSSAPYNTWTSPATASLFVRAIKDRYVPELTFFEVSSSVVGISALTSSKFNDIYNDEQWHLSVGMHPSNAASFASGSSSKYDLVFRGYSYAGDIVKRSFTVSSSISKTIGDAFVQSNHKIYGGCLRNSFVGNVINKSDVKIGNLRFWLTDLSTDELQSHAKDITNHGITNNNNTPQDFETALTGTDLFRDDYRVLDWQFSTITGSNSSGQVDILDLTSGSVARRNLGSYVNEVAGYHYRGSAFELSASATSPIYKDFLTSYSPVEFDHYDADNLVKIKEREKEKFGLNTRFVSFVTTVEKSAQAGITDEMLKLFSSVKELATLIGNPVNKYRQQYRELRVMREKFFRNVSNDVDTEKFLNFYRWLDSGLQTILHQLIPGSAEFNADVFTVVESHVLERNKYQYKFPTAEFRQPDPIASAYSINRSLINWEFNHAPIPLLQNTNSPWWYLRANRSSSIETSGNPQVDFDREQIRSVIYSTVNRSYSTPQRFKVDDLYIAKDVRDATYWSPAIQEFGAIVDIDGPGPLTASVSRDYLLVQASSIEAEKDSNDVLKPNLKVRKDFKIENSREYNESYSYGKGALLAPFTLWSSSVDNGYQQSLSTFSSNIGLNNLHDDTYSRFKNAPLQGPFTEAWVGGWQYRHIDLNTGADQQRTRPEGFYLLWGPGPDGASSMGIVKTTYTTDGTHDSATPRAAMMREITAKRPVNISNIQYSTASSVLGNFRKNYEVVMTNGRTENNLWFHDNSAQALTESEVWNLNRGTTSPYLNATLPTLGVQKSVIVNRFAAPGGPEITSRGYLNPAGEEYSPSNALPFRNTRVLLSSGSGNNDFTGSDPRVNIYTNILTQNDGLRVLLSRHSALYGIDSVFGAVQADNYTTTGSYQKVNRNAFSQSTGINYDNFFVSHQIPRTPAGYSWVRSALNGASGSFSYVLGGLPATEPSGSTSIEIPFAALDTRIEQFPLQDQLYRSPLGYPDQDPVEYTLLEDFSTATRGFLSWAGSPLGVLPAHMTHNTGTSNGEIRHHTGSNLTAFRFAGGYGSGTGPGTYPYLGALRQERALKLTTWLTGTLTGSFLYSQGAFEDYSGNDIDASAFNKFNLDTVPVSDDAYALRLQYATSSVDEPTGTAWMDILVITASLATKGDTVGWLTGSLAFAGPSGSSTGEPYRIRWAQLAYKMTYGGYPGQSYDNWAITNINLTESKYLPLPGAQITSSFYASMTDVGSTEIQNTLSTRSAGIGPSDFIVYTDAINNNLFGYTSFAQTRGGDTRQARSMKENNAFSYRFKLPPIPGGSPRDYIVRNINMSPVVESYPLKHSITTVDDVEMEMKYTFGNEYEFYPLNTSTERILYAISGLDKTKEQRKTTFNFVSSLYVDPQPNGVSVEYDKLAYKQNIWPKSQFAYRQENRQRTQFTIDWWNSSRISRNKGSVVNSLGNTVTSQSVWVIDGVLATGSQPRNLFEPYVSSSSDEYSKKYVFGAGELDNDCMFNYAVVGVDSSASLANGWELTEWEGVMVESRIKPSVLYARPFTINTGSSLLFSMTGSGAGTPAFVPVQNVGGVPWSAGAEAGKEPFYYKNYNDYVLDMRTAGKEYSVIPEFRISEAIADIIDGPSGSNTVLNPTFDITGAFYPNDTNESFYTEFVNSDFLKYFNIIENKHSEADIESLGTLKLSCNALKRFLPYEGFYPAQRVDQIGALFSQSYGDIITITGSGHPLRPNGINEGGSLRTAIIPFFAPGILCNTIKSGVALGYPIFTSSFDSIADVTGTYINNAGGNSNWDRFGARISASYSVRLPFESVTDPLSYITTIIDAEPDENAILYSTASYDSSSAGSDKYRYAVNNFLAETMNLFLKNNSVSSIVSSGENAFRFDTSKEYRMDIRLFEDGLSMYDGDRSFGPPVSNRSGIGNSASFLPYLPPYDIKAFGVEEGVRLTFRPTKERPTVDEILNTITQSYFIDSIVAPGVSYAIDARSKLTDTIEYRTVKTGVDNSRAEGATAAPEFAISIQPKFETPILDFSHRSASIDVANSASAHIFNILDHSKATVGDVITLGDGQIGVPFTVIANTGPIVHSAGQFRIGASASEFIANLSTIIDSGSTTYSEALTLDFNCNKVAASPKLSLGFKAPGELPNLISSISATDASAYSLTTANGSGFYDDSSVADNYYVGMWHQYGRIPTGSQGIKLQIKDVPTSDRSLTGSLADALSLSKLPVKLGQLNNTIVREAIVAVPYTVVDNEKKFFKIDERSFRLAAFGSPSARSEMPADFRNLAEKMKNYVFPPRMDFYNRTNRVNPFAMFIFEFGMELDEQDLADIWQNLPPTSNVGKKQLNSRFEKEESSFEVSYGTEDSWFPEGIPEGTRWMVFKVKQRAAYDYFEQLRKSSLAKGKTSELEPLGAFVNPTYSYNWPYDFFSFVELAKTTAEVKLGEDPAPSLRDRAREEAARGPERGMERATTSAAEEDATSGAPPAGADASRGRGGDFFTGGSKPSRSQRRNRRRERAAEEARRRSRDARERATRTDAEEDATSGAPPAGVDASRGRGPGFFTGE